MDQVKSIIEALPWFAWIGIVAIVSESVRQTIRGAHRHRERMAMIQMGMHPDVPPDSAASAHAKIAMEEEV